MEIWQMILIAFGLSLVLLFIVGFFLPKNVSVERHVEIQATPEEIFPHLNNLRKFVIWSPWTERDPDMLMRFSENPEGAGALYEWKGNKQVKSGAMMITESAKNERVVTEVRFGKNPKPAESVWRLESNGDTTRVTWAFNAEMKSPFSRYFGLFMDKFIGKDYEQGLSNLKSTVELDPEKEKASTPST